MARKKNIAKKSSRKPASRSAMKSQAAMKTNAASKKARAEKVRVKKSSRNAAKAAAVPVVEKSRPRFNTYRISIYIYWLIILFFICATFYILGRSQEILKHGPAQSIEQEIKGVADSLPNAQLADVANEYVATGKDKLLSGDLSGARDDLSLAIEAVPTFAEAYVYRGEVNMQLSDYPNALEDLSRAIDLNNNISIMVVALYDRGILNMRLENYDAALADFDKALRVYQVNPNNILSAHEIYAKRATLNLWAKNWDDAVADYTKAISLDSANYEDYAGRAEALTAKADYDGALADYLTAVRVIAEKIQAESTETGREVMSRAALSYFEKSAAIRLQTSDFTGAISDLESARTIAMALADSDQMMRLDSLIGELVK